ncbi:general stress protein [Mesorhizobium caraganae]|uniref:general stress protein n=1 Tax=Mesorhizobium caraganae TaxID=483206 RepID=UPI0017831A8E|nr:general stress protein [Mesorhizobium caraganae]
MKTVTGLFDNYDDASDAVGELEASGVPHADISIVANNSDDWYEDGDTSKAAEDATGGAGVGAVIGGAGGLLAGLGLMAIPGVGPVVAAGWLAATAVGAVGGAVVGGAAGGIVGALTDSGVSEKDAHVYAEGVRRGGTMVTARVSDELAGEAERILGQANSVNLEDRRGAYEAGGWTGFDPKADPYTDIEVERDRTRNASPF